MLYTNRALIRKINKQLNGNELKGGKEMYTIYICHSKDHEINNVIKKSKLNYYNNIIFEPINKDLNKIRNIITESQFLIIDMSSKNNSASVKENTSDKILEGLSLGIALERDVRIIIISTHNTVNLNYLQQIENKDVITSSTYVEICGILEQKIMGNSNI